MTNCWNDFSDLRPSLATGHMVMRSCRHRGAIPFRDLHVRDKTLCWILALMGNQCSSRLACSGLSYQVLLSTNLAAMFCTLCYVNAPCYVIVRRCSYLPIAIKLLFFTSVMVRYDHITQSNTLQQLILLSYRFHNLNHISGAWWLYHVRKIESIVLASHKTGNGCTVSNDNSRVILCVHLCNMYRFISYIVVFTLYNSGTTESIVLP